MSLLERVLRRNEALYDVLEKVPEELYSTWERAVSNDPMQRFSIPLIVLGLIVLMALTVTLPWLLAPMFPPKTPGRLLLLLPFIIFLAYLCNIMTLIHLIRQKLEVKHARALGIVWTVPD